MKKKIGILTFSDSNNYGAVLQTYALNRVLLNRNYDAEVIDICPEIKLFRDKKFKPLDSAKKERGFRTRMNYLVGRMIECLARFFSFSYKKRLKRTRKFKKGYINFSKKRYSYQDLYIGVDYDVLISGSDQVWNPLSKRSSPEPYFLGFGDKDIKRISYAPSFGVSGLPEGVRNLYSKWLENLDSISVREESGKKIINSLIRNKKKVERVLDPVFLLDIKEWSGLGFDRKKNKKYLLIYSLIGSSYVDSLARYIAKKKGLEIIKISRWGFSRDGKDIKEISSCGPLEFLQLFRNASFVLSSSFHGTAFSILFNKPFYSIIKNKNKMNSRILELLDLFGLRERQVVVGKEFPNEINNLDYKKVNSILKKEKRKSWNFLEKALNG